MIDRMFFERYGPWALVTGASSGIGAEFAQQLAARGMSLFLCARRKDRMDALAARLSASHGVDVRVCEIDLARRDFLPSLLDHVGDRDVGLLVNNAGFGDKGPFVDSDLDMHLRMLDTNCRAPLVLAHTFGKRMVARGRGGIVFTSSTAAFQGLPFSSHYAATKGYDLQLAEGLWYEMRRHGVDVLALCPGPTDTEGPKRTGVDPSKVPVKLMDVVPVVSDALAALGKTPAVIPGLTNRLATLAVKMLPRSVSAAIAGRLMLRVTGR
jgi:short-subunit dehydrogenase